MHVGSQVGSSHVMLRSVKFLQILQIRLQKSATESAESVYADSSHSCHVIFPEIALKEIEFRLTILEHHVGS